MNLQEKQIAEKNKNGCITAIIISAVTLLITLLGFLNGGGLGLVIRTVICLAVIVILIVGYRALRNKDVYRHVCGFSMIALYIATLFTSDLRGMYAILYAIAVLVLMFGDKILVYAGAAVAIIVLLINRIMMVAQGTMSSIDVIIDIAFAVIACLLVAIVVNTQIRHSNESIDAVKTGADVQKKTAEGIVGLAEELNRKFVEAQSVSAALNETMDTTHNSVSEIAESSKMTADAVEQQTCQTADIQQSIQQVGDQAKNIGEISNRTNNSVSEGVALIEKLKEQAAEVAKINMESKATTETLNESIKDVQAITETILGISKQTNLLALNASIEAARAGEAGKGFAVVADEIRTLSESTKEATEQISDIIERLTRDAQSAADSMMQSADYAQKQSELIEETGSKLDAIKAEADELNEGVLQVNGSVQNIIDANSIIMESITNLSATSEEVAASTDTVLSVSDSSMEALQNMNGLLDEIAAISEQMENVAKG